MNFMVHVNVLVNFIMDAEEYDKIFSYLNDGTYIEGLDENERRRIRKRTDTFEIIEGKMYYSKKGIKKLVITMDQKLSILKLCHIDNGSHLGMEKTFYKLSERYYWKGMSADIKSYIKTCEKCQTTNKKVKTTPAELQPVEVPKSTWKKIAIDLIGPYNDTEGDPISQAGYRYVLTVIDYFSNYVEAFPLKRKVASEVADKLYELFCRQGVPLELVSDNGGEFNSILTDKLESLYGYRHILITPYHPQSNGRSERFNQTLKSMLNKSVEENTAEWERYIPKCCFAYNTSRQASTKYSPFFLMYWRNPILPNENLHGETSTTFQKYIEIPEAEIEKSAAQMIDIQKNIAEVVGSNMSIAQKKQKILFDKRHNVQQNEFKKGEKVLVKNMKRKKTLGMNRWLGPYWISDIPKIGTVVLQDINEKIVGKYRQQNVKKYNDLESIEDKDNNDVENLLNELAENENENEEQNENEVQNETEVQNEIEVQNETEVQIENEVQNETEVQNENEVQNETEVQNENEVQNETEVQNNCDENNNFTEDNDNDMFITQSTYRNDVDQLLDYSSPEVDNNNSRPKRQCTNKDRRNSIYEYFSVLKKD